jgi:hypothetical protein
MHKIFHPTISIEKMAAWLDGNLSTEVMSEMAAKIQDNPVLEDVVAMSDAIDADMESFESSGEPLPDELAEDDFDLPNFDRRSDFFGSRMFGQACCSMPAAAMCEMSMPDEAAAEDDEKSLFDKIKDLFSDDDKEKE